jgi:hypothetical protein
MATSLRFVTTNLIEQSYCSLMNGPAVVLAGINSCDGVDAEITRASGSYVTDGVRPGALLSGAMAANFPASTYVLAVTALVLTMSANSTGAAGPIAATFTPYVTRNEVSPFVMENAMLRDRRLLWQATGSTTVDFDLAANRDFRAPVLAGHRGISGAGITSCPVKYAASATGYPPASGGAWTTAATLANPVRDKGAVFAQATGRWVRFEITAATAFTLGKFVLGALDYDLGVISSRGLRRTLIDPNTEARDGGLNPVITYHGDPRYLYTIPYRSIVDSMLDKLEALTLLRKSFVMFDWADRALEARVQRSELASDWNFFSTVNVMDAELNLEQLG